MIRMKTAVKSGEEDITSPNDWPTTFPQLKEVDSLLRCGICYDFLKTSMGIKSCSHTFCSLCIRQYFSYQNKCPTCYTNAVESDLQNNRLIDEIIQKFIDVRSALIQHLHNSKENISSKQEPYLNGSDITKPDKEKRKSLRNKSHDEKQRKEDSKLNSSSADLTSDNIQNQSLNKETEMPGRLTRGSQRLSLSKSKTPGKNGKQKEVEPTSVKDLSTEGKVSMEEDSVLISSDDSENEEDKPLTVPSQQSVNSLSMVENSLEREKCATSPIHIDELSGSIKPVMIPSDTDSIVSLHDQSDVSSNASLVIQTKGDNSDTTAPCPVCGVVIRTQIINLHLDSCLAGTEKKSALRRSVLPKRKPMPKLVYNLLSEKELRKKLKDIGLSVKGDKKVSTGWLGTSTMDQVSALFSLITHLFTAAVLIKRHHDYVVRYNADCDSLNPKSVEEILKEVEKNEQEKAKTTKTPFMSKKLVVEKGSSPGTVRKAQEKYEKAHEKQFTDLIKATRQRMQSKTTNIKRQTRSSVTDKADTANSITSGKHAPSEKVAIRSGICEQSQTEHSGLDFVISEPELSDSDSSKPRTRRSLRLFKDKMSDVDETTENKSKLNKERKSTKQIDGRKFEQKQDKLVKMDMNQESNGKNCTDERNRDKNNDDGKFDCSKCIDKKQPVSPCQIHKNKVHIQVEVHTSPKCSRHLLFKKDNKSEDDLKSSNDTDENESIRASRRTRSSISKIKSDHVTNSNNKELHLNNLSTSTERKRNKKAETHGVLKIQETSKEACDVDQNPKCLPDKSKEAIGNTEKVTESIEKSPNKSSARKYRPDLTKSNNERETELTTVKKCLGQDINEHFSKQATRKSASDLTNIGNENETEFTLIKDKYSPRKSASDLTGMNTEREMQFTLETDYLNKDIETESVAKHSCNLYKILKDSPSKSPFKDKYLFSFSSPRNDKVHINKCAEESPTEISPKLNVLFPKTDSPVKFSLRRDIMSPGETSPQKFSSKASILSPGTKSPGKCLSKRDVLSPGANSPSKKSFKADVLSPGVNSPSKKSFKANLLSPGANSPSKKSLKADILSPTVNSPSKKSLKADILSPRVNSPSKKSSKTNLLSPGTNPPSNTSFKAHGTNSPSKTLANTHKIKSPGTKSPHKILSPRKAGLSCSPLRQHKLVKTGDITWNIVDDSESETDLNDSLINKITKSIDKFESDEDEVIFSDFKKTWPVLSSQSSTKSERYGKTDDSTLESETESNCSFGSDISNVVPETAPIKLQKTDYFVNRRSHSRSKCKEDKCAKLRNKRKHATTGGNQESKRRRIN